MPKRDVITLLLLVLTFFVSSVWKAFETPNPVYIEPFLLSDVVITYNDFLWGACDSMEWVLVAIVVYRLSRMRRELRLAASAILLRQSFNFIFFFVNYNQMPDSVLFSIIILYVAVVAFRAILLAKSPNADDIKYAS